MSPRWFSKSALPFKKMWADDPYWLPLVLAGKNLNCKFKLSKNGKIIDAQVTEVENFST
jgi:8-oxo-dGTP diphosphatase